MSNECETKKTRVQARLPSKQGYVPRFLLDESPITEVHAFWIAGMSCDGCSIAAVGAKHPTVEQLITGTIPGLPKVILHHPVLSVTAGAAFMKAFHAAKNGTLGAPYVICLLYTSPSPRDRQKSRMPSSA